LGLAFVLSFYQINKYSFKKNNLSASIFAENEQLLSGNTEYTRVPEISISKKVINPNNREINFSAISTKFKHKDPTKETGTRLHTQAAFVRNIETSAYSIKPKFTLSKTKYLMDVVRIYDFFTNGNFGHTSIFCITRE
jgi:LPS-assembly protein